MSFRPPRIYGLTDRRLTGGASHAGQVTRLAAAGIRMLQVRDKQLPDRELLPDLDQALAAGRRRGSLVVVNDRPDLARLAEAGGVHLGEEDMPVAAARALLGPAAVIGRSSHDPESARAGEAAGADYVAFGPVFPTSTKPDAGPATGLEALAAVRKAVRVPLVAIGGITRDEAPRVLAAGADAVAVIRDLVAAPEGIESRVAAWRAALDGPADLPRGLLLLTGFMGSGKSAVGAALARLLGRRFVDLDDWVQRREGMTVAEIFSRRGEPFFREAESACLAALPQGADAVVALGGGTLLSPASRRRVHQLGSLVWLDCPLEESLRRCGPDPARPLLVDPDAAGAHRSRRLPGYREASLRVETAGRTPEAAAADIAAWVAGTSGPPASAFRS